MKEKPTEDELARYLDELLEENRVEIRKITEDLCILGTAKYIWGCDPYHEGQTSQGKSMLKCVWPFGGDDMQEVQAPLGTQNE